MTMICSKCCYFELSSDFPSDNHKGRCHRFPPIGDGWAIVTAYDRCGEFLAKTEQAHERDNIHDAMGGREIKNDWYRIDNGGIAM